MGARIHIYSPSLTPPNIPDNAQRVLHPAASNEYQIARLAYQSDVALFDPNLEIGLDVPLVVVILERRRRYYNTTERMTGLFAKITDQMILNCKDSIMGGGNMDSLWDKVFGVNGDHESSA